MSNRELLHDRLAVYVRRWTRATASWRTARARTSTPIWGAGGVKYRDCASGAYSYREIDAATVLQLARL